MAKYTEDLRVKIEAGLSREIDRVAEEREVTRSEVARDLLDIGYLMMAASRDIEFSYNLWEILQKKVPEEVGKIERHIKEEYGENKS